MDQLYFSSISNMLADFFLIRGETLNAIKELSLVSKSFDNYSPSKYEFGLYMGAGSGQTHKQIHFNLDGGLGKKNRETFQRLYERTEVLISRLKMAIVPPSIAELHNMLREIADLHLKGYGMALEILNTGNINLIPGLMNIFEECNNKLSLFEQMQRNMQSST